MSRAESILDYFTQCSKAAVDSRKVVPGALFFALKGASLDGHAFLQDAKDKGARGAVVSEDYSGSSFDLNLFRVRDPLKTLQEIAKIKQRQRKSQIVAITGSVGKTTTKDFISHLLSQKFKVGKSPGNANSQVGTPLAILNELTGDEDIVVLEMGMTHPGNILRLVEIAPPDVAVITSIHLVHAENFSSIEGIAKAKGEILTHPKTRLAILHHKMAHYSFAPIEKHYYSVEDALGGEHLPEHFRENLAAAVHVARFYLLSESEICQGASTLQGSNRRFELKVKRGVQFVNDAYNASEASMIAAFRSLPKTMGRTLAVLGEMRELGKFSEQCHENVARAALEVIDELWLVGEGCLPIQRVFEAAGKKAPIFKKGSEVLPELQKSARHGDVVLLKGSSHWHLWDIEEAF